MISCQKKVGKAYENDDLTIWPDAVDTVDEIDVALLELRGGYIIRAVVIIRPDVNDNQIRRRMSREVPQFGLIAPDLDRTAARIARPVELIGLSVEIPIAFFVHEADAGVCLDAELNIAQPFGETPGPG